MTTQVTVARSRGIDVVQLARVLAQHFGPITIGEGERVNGVPLNTVVIEQ